MPDIDINPQFEQVLEFIDRTSRTIFLTGNAGTGKTTLLKHIRSSTYKQMAVCAPTGVAAINAGGSTIHSFFQFPFGPFLPRVKANGDIDTTVANLPALKFNRQRLNVFRSLELLVIDEVSMVRADLLDQIDITLRYTRKKWDQPFGGVQMLLIGDMHQLPPVVQKEESALLNAHYKSFYFFDSYVIRKYPPVHIELRKVYRQTDRTFIDLLNKVRNNDLDASAHAELNKHYKADISQADYAENVTLTTHNRKADEINKNNLEILPGKIFNFRAEVKGVFPEKNYPAAEVLELKVGARVMFLKNNNEKNYYNGKTGVISSIDNDTIKVQCESDQSLINVGKEVWSNISYKTEKNTRHINEDVLGTFAQFPLRPAWAITIHKSQGLTFDNVIIDAAEAFSAGQVYVALSRCRSLQGLTLSSKIVRESLQNDKDILTFASGRLDDLQLTHILQDARRGYLLSVIFGIFDFREQAEARRELAALMQVHDRRLDTAAKNWLATLFDKIDRLQIVAQKFSVQLESMSLAGGEPENDQALQARIKKAAVYFGEETSVLISFLKSCGINTESKEAATDFNETLQTLFETLHEKTELLDACTAGFSFESFLRKKLKIEYPSQKINVYASARNSRAIAGIKHPALYRELMLLRDEICNEDQKPIYLVANSKTLGELANYLPTTDEQLLKISGFGKAKVETYGERFLELIRNYCQENNIWDEFDFNVQSLKKKKKSDGETTSGKKAGGKGDTREKSLALFRQGFSPEEIATQRGLVTGTILAHLVPYVASGEVAINKLVSSEKQELITGALKDFSAEQGLGAVKSKLPDEVSFADIKFVLASNSRKTGESAERKEMTAGRES